MKILKVQIDSTVYQCRQLTTDPLPPSHRRHAHQYPSTVKVHRRVQMGDTHQYTSLPVGVVNKSPSHHPDNLSCHQFHRCLVEQLVAVVQRPGQRKNPLPLYPAEPRPLLSNLTHLYLAVLPTDPVPEYRPQRRLHLKRDRLVHRCASRPIYRTDLSLPPEGREGTVNPLLLARVVQAQFCRLDSHQQEVAHRLPVSHCQEGIDLNHPLLPDRPRNSQVLHRHQRWEATPTEMMGLLISRPGKECHRGRWPSALNVTYRLSFS